MQIRPALRRPIELTVRSHEAEITVARSKRTATRNVKSLYKYMCNYSGCDI